MSKGLVLDTRYVGSRGVGLVGRVNIAQPLDPRRTPVNGFTDIRNSAGAIINPDFFVPNEFLGLNRNGGFALVSNVGHSTYHSFQTNLRGRMNNRANWNVAYTWSKSIDNISSDTDIAEHDGSRLFNNRGVSNFDRTHRLTAAYVLELPSFSSDQKFLHTITGGWRMSGLFTMQSGAPFTVLGASGQNAFFAQVSRVRVNLAPGRTNDSAIKTGRIQDRVDSSGQIVFFDPTAFVNSGDAWGNLGRNTLRGPRQTQFDVSFSKTAKLRESLGMEFRWEFFNAFNTPIFANPAATIAGTAAATQPGTAGRITATIGGPRTMQAAMRLTF